MQFEVNIIVALQSIANDNLTSFFEIISLFGSYLGFAILFLLFFCINKKFSFLFAFCFLFGVGFNYLLKLLINRPRPYVSYNQIMNLTNTFGQSMPSSHALCSVIMALFLCYFIFKITNKKFFRVFFIIFSSVFVLLICLSRLYLGLHYLTDILVGAIIGAIISFIGFYIYKKRGQQNDL